MTERKQPKRGKQRPAEPEDKLSLNDRLAPSPASSYSRGTRMTYETGSKVLAPDAELFLSYYVVNRNVAGACAHTWPDTAVKTSVRRARVMLESPIVKRRLAEIEMEAAEYLRMQRQDLLNDLALVLQADPSEISQLRRVACEQCWHDSGEPVGQWDDPDPECPRCNGQGEARAWFADTRDLSPAARRIYRGVKITRSGIEVEIESRMDALDKIARILGAYKLPEPEQPPPAGLGQRQPVQPEAIDAICKVIAAKAQPEAPA